uniref:Uncharacterized protein n=1 Tax=Romanomermis culicivorax TaxID=13658 RepID=A0A915I3L3_ROMCU
PRRLNTSYQRPILELLFRNICCRDSFSSVLEYIKTRKLFRHYAPEERNTLIMRYRIAYTSDLWILMLLIYNSSRNRGIAKCMPKIISLSIVIDYALAPKFVQNVAPWTYVAGPVDDPHLVVSVAAPTI